MQLSHIFALSLIILHVLSIQSWINHEREALLEFKAGIVRDRSKRLASWSGNDCCNWMGIRCSNQTGHVVQLNLGNYSLIGDVSPSLIGLSNLEYLDLSYNGFFRVPEIIGSFKELKYLNLSSTYLIEKIPPQLGNLTRLEFLDLSNSYLWDSLDISWLSHLQSLRYLDMSWVNLTDSKEWVQSLNKLPSLEVLILYNNGLTYIPQSLSYVNFSSLILLFLAEQQFNTTIPSWIFSLHQLTYPDLENCNFFGPFPVALGNLSSLTELAQGENAFHRKLPSLHNLTKLKYLFLSGISLDENFTDIYSRFSHETWRKLEVLALDGCNLHGTLTRRIGEMSNLNALDLSFNNLTGPITVEIRNLRNLVELQLSYTSFIGTLTASHLYSLSELKVLRIDNNPISIAMESNSKPTFQLQILDLTSTQVGPKFPTWLQNQVNIEALYLSEAGINDVIPDWLWSFGSLSSIFLSNNKIRGKLPESLKNMKKLTDLFLNGNQLEGKLPTYFPNYISTIDLSNNRLQQLPKSIQAPELSSFSVSNNNLSGNIQFSLCQLTRLTFFDFSKNILSGYLPNCSLPSLLEVNIANNKFKGTIPSSLCRVSPLSSLLVMNNNLTGPFPTSLQFCTKIVALGLGENNFVGSVPEWVGNLTQLEFLSLRSNSFSGRIPTTLTSLNNIRILDLADNYFCGPIPTHLENFTMMSYHNSTSYPESWSVSMKGIILQYIYAYSLSYIGSVDLSNNYLTGEIPETIVTLAGLINLNLSKNQLTGKIPVKIGNIKSLESLDIHMNNLSGPIPESLSTSSFLEVLNVSYNNLSGSIPAGNQLQTLVDPSIYIGNPYLCGPPLKTSCNSGGSSPDHKNNYSSNFNNSGHKEKLWFYLFIELGFVIGFMVVIFILLFKRSWRSTYFRWVDNKFDKLYVSGALILKKLRKE